MSTDPKTVQSYDDFAQAYTDHTDLDKDSPYHAFYEKPAIQAEVPDLKGRTVISIGCGPGVDTEWLRNQGATRAVGVDISDGLIAIAREKYPKCEFSVMDMEELNFPDDSFDFAYSSLALHYVSDWDKALKEAFRILKPGSLYVFSCGHPIDSALETTQPQDGFKEKKLGYRVNQTTGERITYGDYLAAGGGGIRHFSGDLLPGMTVGVFHRPVSKMIESITKAGFVIKKLNEPIPLPELAMKDPNHYEYMKRIPAFMVWVLFKR